MRRINRQIKNSEKTAPNNRDQIKRINDTGFKEGMQSIIHVFKENNYVNEVKILQDCLNNKYLTGKAVSILVEYLEDVNNHLFVFIEQIYLKYIEKGMNQIEATKSMDKEIASYISLRRIINKYFIVNITNEEIYVSSASDKEEVA